MILTHSIHVWYIYLHLPYKNCPNVGEYTIHGWYGLISWSFMYQPAPCNLFYVGPTNQNRWRNSSSLSTLGGWILQSPSPGEAMNASGGRCASLKHSIHPPEFCSMTRWWFPICFYIFTLKIGEDEPNLTSIFFKGVETCWNHQLDEVWRCILL